MRHLLRVLAWAVPFPFVVCQGQEDKRTEVKALGQEQELEGPKDQD